MSPSSRSGGRPAADERRSGIRWLVASVLVLVAMLGMWWLVEETNEEGTHDAELLPFFALIPLAIGAFHLARSRSSRRAGSGGRRWDQRP